MTSKVYSIANLAAGIVAIIGQNDFAKSSGEFGLLCAKLDHIERNQRNALVTALQRRISFWLLGAKAFGCVNQLDKTQAEYEKHLEAVRTPAKYWKDLADGADIPNELWAEAWGAAETAYRPLIAANAAILTDRARLAAEASQWALIAAASDVLEAQATLARRAYNRRALSRRAPGHDYTRSKRDADKAFCYALLAELVSVTIDITSKAA